MKYLIVFTVIVGLIIIVYIINKSRKEQAQIAAQQAALASIITGGTYQLGSVTAQQGGVLAEIGQTFTSIFGF